MERWSKVWRFFNLLTATYGVTVISFFSSHLKSRFQRRALPSWKRCIRSVGTEYLYMRPFREWLGAKGRGWTVEPTGTQRKQGSGWPEIEKKNLTKEEDLDLALGEWVELRREWAQSEWYVYKVYYVQWWLTEKLGWPFVRSMNKSRSESQCEF